MRHSEGGPSIPYWRKLLASGGSGAGELKRRDAVAALEMLGERTLVVETDVRRDLGDRPRMSEMPAGCVQPDLGQVGMGRQSRRALEQANELEGREPDVLRQILQPKVLCIFRAHALPHPF